MSQKFSFSKRFHRMKRGFHHHPPTQRVRFRRWLHRDSLMFQRFFESKRFHWMRWGWFPDHPLSRTVRFHRWLLGDSLMFQKFFQSKRFHQMRWGWFLNDPPSQTIPLFYPFCFLVFQMIDQTDMSWGDKMIWGKRGWFSWESNLPQLDSPFKILSLSFRPPPKRWWIIFCHRGRVLQWFKSLSTRRWR